MYLSTLALITLAAAAPYALPNPSSTSLASCTTPGQLLCNGPNQFALCTESHSVTWMATADGTSCICTSAESCDIVASNNASNISSSQTALSTPTSAPVSASISPTAYATSSSSPAASATASAPSSSPAAPSGTGSKYTQFNGDGSPGDGWPIQSDWLQFDDLFDAYEPIMTQNCMTAFGVPNTPTSVLPVLRNALMNESAAVGVPAQFSLAIMMQESLGCVFVDTTNNGVVNPGLFQDHDGSASCWHDTSCPPSQIQGMVKQGVSGTSSGAGLEQCITQAPGTGAQKFYQAARIYNSGSLPSNGNLGESLGSTSCYASDIANRLIGWTSGESGCTLAE